MAISLSLYLDSVTSSSATFEINGDFDTYYDYKRIQIINANTNVEIDHYFQSVTSSSIICSTDNIFQPNTSYSVYIDVYFWRPEFSDWTFQGQSNTISFTTEGGSPGTNATYVFQVVGNNINIDILDAGSNPQFYAYLYDNPSGSGTPLYNSYSSGTSGGFAGIPDGTYYLNVYYLDSSTDWTDLKNRYTGQIYALVTIGSGPSPSDNYSYPHDDSANVTSISSIEGWHSGSAYEGWFFTFNFDNSGTLRLYSSNLNGSMQSYIGTVDRDYDPSTGRPILYDDSATGNFDFTWNGSAGDTLYLWVNSIGNSSYSFYLNATFSGGGGTTPTYTAQVINTNQILFSVSDRGSYYLRYFVRLTDSPQTTIYDTWSEYGYLTTNTLLTVSNLQYNTSYTVNVGYSTTNSSGTVTWIGSQVLTTGTQSFTYTLINGITVSNSNPSPKRISFSRNNGVIVPITISYNGIITIYTETDQSSRMDDQAYLCTSSNVSYDDKGVVDSTSQYYIKSDDESHGNNQFQMTINNTNVGTNTYYLYIRGYPDSGVPRAINTLLYAILPNEGYVYIYDGSNWRKAVPYIYDGSTWRKAIPYIYDGNSWKKTTG